jgi:transposase
MSLAAQTLACGGRDSVHIPQAAPDGTRGDVSEIASTRDFIRISHAERAALLKCARSRTLAARVVLRSRIVLLATEGVPRAEIARRLGTTSKTTALWLGRFRAGGFDALAKDAPGRGRKRSIGPAAIDAARAALKSGMTVREIARRTGISPASVLRLKRRQL